MANKNAPRGFTPVGTVTGADWSASVKTFNVDSSNAAAIRLGDFVSLAADGNVNKTAAATGTDILGAVVGIYHTDGGSSTARTLQGGGTYDLNLSKKGLAASTAGKVMVCTDPLTYYQAQDDGDTTQLALTDIGANVDFIDAATATDRSDMEIDSSTAVATTAQLRLVEFVEREDNAIGANAEWIVVVHPDHHFFSANNAGV